MRRHLRNFSLFLRGSDGSALIASSAAITSAFMLECCCEILHGENTTFETKNQFVVILPFNEMTIGQEEGTHLVMNLRSSAFLQLTQHYLRILEEADWPPPSLIRTKILSPRQIRTVEKSWDMNDKWDNKSEWVRKGGNVWGESYFGRLRLSHWTKKLCKEPKWKMSPLF